MSRFSSNKALNLSLASAYIPKSDKIVVCSTIGTDSKGAASRHLCHQCNASSYSPRWSTIKRPPFTQASTLVGSKSTTLLHATNAFDAWSISGYLPSGANSPTIIHQALECSGSAFTASLACSRACSNSPFSSASIASR